MDLKVINCVLAEYLRPEPGGKMTAIGMPFVIQLRDATKPCYPLSCLLQLQGTEPGEVELALVIRDVAAKKDVAAVKNKIKIAGAANQKNAEPRTRGGIEISPAKKNAPATFNIVQILPLQKLIFGHAGEFDVAVFVDQTVKKTFKLLVMEAKPENNPNTKNNLAKK